mgnify:CR=1 FL=1
MNKKLKPIPAGNKGLPNLPKPVRNKMGFLKEGGMADKRSPFMGGGIAYAGGGRAMKREMRAGGGPGLYANIAAKKRRIAAGSGEKMRTAGSKGAPTKANFKRAAQTAKKV